MYKLRCSLKVWAIVWGPLPSGLHSWWETGSDIINWLPIIFFWDSWSWGPLLPASCNGSPLALYIVLQKEGIQWVSLLLGRYYWRESQCGKKKKKDWCFLQLEGVWLKGLASSQECSSWEFVWFSITKNSFVVVRGQPACKQMSKTGKCLPVTFLAKPQAGLLPVLLK